MYKFYKPEKKKGVEYKSCILGGLCYFTWVGFLPIFFACRKKNEFVRWHLNQSLVLNVFATAIAAAETAAVYLLPDAAYEAIDLIAGIMSILVIVGWILGWIGAMKGRKNMALFFGMISWIK